METKKSCIDEQNDKIIRSVIIIGTGSVASTFIQQFHAVGISVIEHCGRTEPKEKLVQFQNIFSEIRTDADLYIVAVSDDSIELILDQLPKFNGIIVHTAGSVSSSVFSSKFQHYGVFYPLQSFSKNRSINLQNTPFLIEGNSNHTEKLLLEFALKISKTSIIVPFEKRLQIHLAAVFASNFSNHMNSIAQSILADNCVDFELLKPLLEETFDKILHNNPIESQTGPAKRGDIKILEKHSEMLTSNTNFKEIYKLVSKSIADFYKKQ